MPRFNLYDRTLVERHGGAVLLERMAAKLRGGENFITGRRYEFLYASYRLLEMASRRFDPVDNSWRDVRPFDIAESLECLIDDLLIREGTSSTFFQFKSGAVKDKPLIASDIRAQQDLDVAHGRFANYRMVVTSGYKKEVEDWIEAQELRCDLEIFPKTHGILPLLDEIEGFKKCMMELTGSGRPGAWVTLHRQALGIWLESGDASIDSIFHRLVAETRHMNPPLVNDRARIASLSTLLSEFGFKVRWDAEAALLLTAELEETMWSCVVTCSTELLDAFEDWYIDLDDLSQGDLMDWFAESLGREMSDVA
ncbi:hypothetical protein CO662_20675 [Rhizobium anhuiense]|uniref:Restriction endonuclease n=1 Tax=Rhizobium anhuiense TaxID=1184720 RepID=A0ABX4J4E8_9HYPH|nr:hypothetical protein [Rhizobium anhuiense]PDS43176.1 hypothetical protein CO668_18890 [Rhizobium anhuiense]PDS49917.1 hypothetical protein CO662_20675 [Rhizobium anhuiense]